MLALTSLFLAFILLLLGSNQKGCHTELVKSTLLSLSFPSLLRMPSPITNVKAKRTLGSSRTSRNRAALLPHPLRMFNYLAPKLELVCQSFVPSTPPNYDLLFAKNWWQNWNGKNKRLSKRKHYIYNSISIVK